MQRKNVKLSARYKRQRRVRRKIQGTGACPRLSVFRSNKHIYVQVIDDETQRTLVSASTMDKEMRDGLEEMGKKDVAKAVGKFAGERALAAGIDRVVFDRNGYIYHGRVAAVAEGAREAGLNF